MGQRLRKEALSVRINDKNIWDIASLDVKSALSFFNDLELDQKEAKISENLLPEIISRLDFLLEVGLDYILLNQEASTLSRGEAQRIRLASQIGSSFQVLSMCLMSRQ